ncbi:unnamed protein product [Lactuca saligna]|uniref:Phytocyanin domain-containing protein n=1 Tax=Lactuca saligna TaxID=75948 RepID=A0AA35UR99_LACSI|nr:unnamed protein product [Lactuca saligna]
MGDGRFDQSAQLDAEGWRFTIHLNLEVHFTAEQGSIPTSAATYGPCTATNPISLATTGPASLTLTTTGTHYYICTFTSHCQLGQKLTINISADASTTPPSATPKTPASPPTTIPTPPTPVSTTSASPPTTTPTTSDVPCPPHLISKLQPIITTNCHNLRQDHSASTT